MTRRTLLLTGMALGLGLVALALTRASFGLVERALLVAALTSFALGALRRGGGAGNVINTALAVAYSALVIGCLALAYVLLGPRLPRRDLTTIGLNTLSPLSEKWLATVTQPIELIAFLEQAQIERFRRQFDRLREVNDRVTYEILDPLRDTARALEFGDKVFPGDVFVRAGEKVRRVVGIEGIAEGDLVNAMIAVLREGPTTVYFLAGHGEPGLDETKNPEERMNRVSLLAENLAVRGLAPQQVRLSNGADVPADALCVICLAPQEPLSAPEVESMKRYAARGGRILLAPGFGGLAHGSGRVTSMGGWNEVAAMFGVEILEEFVADMAGKHLHGSEMIAVPTYKAGQRPIPRDDPDHAGIAFLQTRAVRRITPEPPGVTSTVLLWSSPQSFRLSLERLARGAGTAEVSPDAAAPEPLVVTSRRRDPGGDSTLDAHLLVIGSHMPYVDAASSVGAIRMFLRSVDDLTADGRAFMLPIPVREIPDQFVVLPPRTARFLLIFHLLFIPGCLFFGGLGFTLARRGD